jgi:hydroxyacylglutathione hydrolase
MGRLVELMEGVFVATSEMEQMTTTVVVGESGGCLLVDAGGTPAEMEELAAELAERGLHPVIAWSTHAHWRHCLWHNALGDVPRRATAAAAAWAEAHREDLEREVGEAGLGHDAALVGRLSGLEEDTEALEWEGPDTVVGALETHAAGHGALMFPGLELLVAGDLCSDVQIPLVDPEGDNPVEDYRTVLDVLRDLEGVTKVVPGHGTPCDMEGLKARIALDDKYLADLQAGETSDDGRLTDAPPWLLTLHATQVANYVKADDEAPKEQLPIVAEIPADVESQLEPVLATFVKFNQVIAPFCETNHLDVAGIAEALEPVSSAEGVAGSEEQVAAWAAIPDAQLDALKRVIELAGEATKLVRDYAAAMKETFKDAVIPEPPPEEAPAEG